MPDLVMSLAEQCFQRLVDIQMEEGELIHLINKFKWQSPTWFLEADTMCLRTLEYHQRPRNVMIFTFLFRVSLIQKCMKHSKVTLANLPCITTMAFFFLLTKELSSSRRRKLLPSKKQRVRIMTLSITKSSFLMKLQVCLMDMRDSSSILTTR